MPFYANIEAVISLNYSLCNLNISLNFIWTSYLSN